MGNRILLKLQEAWFTSHFPPLTHAYPVIPHCTIVSFLTHCNSSTFTKVKFLFFLWNFLKNTHTYLRFQNEKKREKLEVLEWWQMISYFSSKKVFNELPRKFFFIFLWWWWCGAGCADNDSVNHPTCKYVYNLHSTPSYRGDWVNNRLLCTYFLWKIL